MPPARSWRRINTSMNSSRWGCDHDLQSAAATRGRRARSGNSMAGSCPATSTAGAADARRSAEFRAGRPHRYGHGNDQQHADGAALEQSAKSPEYVLDQSADVGPDHRECRDQVERAIDFRILRWSEV